MVRHIQFGMEPIEGKHEKPSLQIVANDTE